ncbi:PREDICTED: gamma-secretase subunit Aph-1 [Bactrocera latifrons]|uniref:Gamma-secretase subunit Aph-1 n=1 Tax=Bactrocera latifrons TaxID=174628 RepID=A0A0K8VT06_BACLA|nr:PREDICTED: gamma-secretase subunit Aph-1 [Bactrocera latifrons]
MTLPEFFGCSFIAFGTPFAMFVFTIANDSIRIIILIAAAFFWLLSLLSSALLWFAIVPLREYLWFGVIFSVLFQEGFRYIIYRILRRTEQGLQAVSENPSIIENKHILAYVSGLGFGIISGMFSMVNLLADMSGPATMGLKGGSEVFLITSSTQALAMILLHTFWSIIFFNGFDVNNYMHIAYVVGTHLFVSLITLLNVHEMYLATLLPNYIILLATAALAFKVAGGSKTSFLRFVKCQ